MLIGHRIKDDGPEIVLPGLDWQMPQGGIDPGEDPRQTVMRELRGRLSGLCQPSYVLDIPGGKGKSPIGPNYLSGDGTDAHPFAVEDYRGARHAYPPEDDRSETYLA